MPTISAVGVTTELRTPWRRWVLPAAAVLGVGPWGALAGAALVWVVGDSAGVTFADPGLLAFRFWPAMWLLLGLSVGFAVGAYLALRLVERSPRALGGLLVLWAALTVTASLADPSGWDWLVVWVPGLLLSTAVVRRQARPPRPPESRQSAVVGSTRR